MCLPIALAAIAIGSSVMAYMGQNAAASANQHAANLNAANQFTVREQSRAQTDQRSAEERVNLAVESAQNFGRIAQSSSVMGVGASTTAQALNASSVATGRATAVGDQNFMFGRQQNSNDIYGDQLQRASQINSVPKGNPAALALGIAGGAASGYTTGLQMNALRAKAA